MTSEQVMDAFKEKGIEVTIYQSPFKTIEKVVVDTYNHDKQIRADASEECASLLAFICKKYDIPLVDMNCTVDEWGELKEHK